CSDGNEEPKADASTNTDGASNNETVNNEDGELEPVTLLMVTHWWDEQFKFTFKEHLEEKYPHITLEHVQSGSDELEENVFAKDSKPDIMMTSVSDYLLDIDLLLDLNPLIEQFNFDINRPEPG